MRTSRKWWSMSRTWASFSASLPCWTRRRTRPARRPPWRRSASKWTATTSWCSWNASHSKTLKIHGHERPRGYFSTGNSGEGKTHHRRSHGLPRAKYVGCHVQVVGAHRQVGEIHECARHPHRLGGDVEEPPVPCSHVRRLRKGQPLDVVPGVRSILQQPDERVDRFDVLHHLVATERGTGRVGSLEGSSRVNVAESLSPVGRNRRVPVASVEHHVAVQRHTRLVHVGSSLAGCGRSKFRVPHQRDLASDRQRRTPEKRQFPGGAMELPLRTLSHQRQQLPGMNFLRPRDGGRLTQVFYFERFG